MPWGRCSTRRSARKPSCAPTQKRARHRSPPNLRNSPNEPALWLRLRALSGLTHPGAQPRDQIARLLRSQHAVRPGIEYVVLLVLVAAEQGGGLDFLTFNRLDAGP